LQSEEVLMRLVLLTLATYSWKTSRRRTNDRNLRAVLVALFTEAYAQVQIPKYGEGLLLLLKATQEMHISARPAQ
jgi:hypothetical protein